MKTIYIKSLLLLVLGLVLTPVVAYEPPTHGLLSEAAFLASDLEQDNDLYQDLGISKEDIFLRSDGEYKEIVEILKFGSAKEDSVIPAPRPPNHFFNPLNDEGLIDFIYYPTTPIFVDFFPSPSWILEDDGQIENFLFLFDQDYSYADAVSYFYDALTLADGEERKDKFGKLFETLGHVIHHVQDMAQPEHVRDDPHLTFFDNSAYEKYVLDKTADELINSQLPVSGYPVPDVGTFGKARDFWIHDQEGLAEFTNYNFVSVDTNFRGDLNNIIPDPDFPNPNGINAVVNQVSGAELGIPTFAENAGWFIETPVVDSLNPDQSIPNIHTSFYSLYDSDLEVMGFDKIFSLNTFTFQSAMEFLIPRAVSYSAGLINHFFRGRLEVSSAIYGAENNVEVLVKNISSDGNDFINREFEVYYDKNDGTRGQISPVTVEGGSTQALAVNATAKLIFDPPNDLDETKEKPFVIVYNDQIGEEEGAAGVNYDVEPLPPVEGIHYFYGEGFCRRNDGFLSYNWLSFLFKFDNWIEGTSMRFSTSSIDGPQNTDASSASEGRFSLDCDGPLHQWGFKDLDGTRYINLNYNLSSPGSLFSGDDAWFENSLGNWSDASDGSAFIARTGDGMALNTESGNGVARARISKQTETGKKYIIRNYLDSGQKPKLKIGTFAGDDSIKDTDLSSGEPVIIIFTAVTNITHFEIYNDSTRGSVVPHFTVIDRSAIGGWDELEPVEIVP